MARSNRKTDGERLRLAAERLDLLFAYAPDAYYLSDQNGTFVGVNRAAEERSGYGKEELIGKNFLELGLLSQDQVPVANELLARSRRGERTGPDELTMNRKDGTQVSLEITTFPLIIGNQPLVLGLARDITERKDAEEQLRATKNRLDFLLSTSPAVIYSARAAGDYGATFISENVVAQTGYDAREFTEDSAFWVDHIHPDDRPRVLTGLSLLLEHGHHVYEYRFLHKDGTYRWMADESRLVRDADGEPLEMIGYWMDITGRKLAEEELQKARDGLESRVKERTADLAAANEQLLEEIAEREEAQRALQESEETFHGIILSAPEAVVVVGADGCISLVNDQAEVLFGYAEGEMIGQTIELLIPTARRDAHIDERRRFAAAPHRRPMASDLNISARHKNGHVIPVEVSLSPLESPAGPVVVTT
ncbi:MAG: PAS domain S-box protein, partial [Dehalococcoidia bacterium]